MNGKGILRKFGGIFLACAVAVTMLAITPVASHAETVVKDVKAGDFTFTLYLDSETSGSIWLTGYSGTAKEVTLPTSVTYNGVTYDLRDNGTYFEGCVGDQLFKGNSVVEKIIVPNGYGMISQEAFNGCPNLAEVVLGDTVSYVSTHAFSNCPKLVTYRFGSTDLSCGSGDYDPGIGKDSSGNLYAGVTAYLKEGSAVDTFLKGVNSTSANGNTIELKYSTNPAPEANVVNPADGGGTPDPTPEPKPDPAKQMGQDGTPYGKGASSVAADKALKVYKSEKDPKGTVFNQLQLRAGKVTKASVQLKWKAASGAKKYVIYGNNCGKTKYVKLTTTTKKAITFKKINKAKVKKGTYYKFIIVAIDAKNNVVCTSKTVHVATTGGKVGNDKAITTNAKKGKVTVKKGKAIRLKTKSVPASKKLKVKRHRTTSFESSNKKIATVNAKGVIKGVKKGTCYVYAYTQNGAFAKVKVTVK